MGEAVSLAKEERSGRSHWKREELSTALFYLLYLCSAPADFSFVGEALSHC